MRKLTIIAALALTLLIAAPMTATAVQEQEQQEQQAEQQLEGSLQAVDLEAMNITVTDDNGGETTVAVSEETTVSGPDGPLTVADLQGMEGSEVVVHVVDDGAGPEALSIQLVA